MKTLHLICDNRPFREGFIPSWGLSIGLEENGWWTLFDLGNSPDIFSRNFTLAGGDMSRVRRVILSHLHHDHAGGLGAFRGSQAPITLHLPELVAPDEVQALKAWGFDANVVPVDGLQSEDLWILPIPSGHLPEQLLVIEERESVIVLTGCAHYGIETGLWQVWDRFRKPFSLVCGGFHLAFRSPLEAEHVMNVLSRLPIGALAPCHCTGDSAINKFQERFPEQFIRVGAGWFRAL